MLKLCKMCIVTNMYGGLSLNQQTASIFANIKSLFKGLVLISNVLPIFAGFWLALFFTNTPLHSEWPTLLIVFLGGTLIVGGALVINNWYEVDLDREMKRTINRPTVTGAFSLKSVLAIGVILTIIGFAILTLTTWEALLYAFIGWFTYVVLYTFWSKRKYTLNTVIGSISGAVTPLIGWAAVTSAMDIVPMGLALILFLWQIPHTFAIAIKRRDEYKAAGVPMLPVARGIKVTKQQMFIYVLCLLPIPFFLRELGLIFMTIATLLNAGWIVVCLKGFSAENDYKWAHTSFIYSLNYLLILFITMIAVTL